MVSFGYKLMAEEHGPADLLRYAQRHDDPFAEAIALARMGEDKERWDRIVELAASLSHEEFGALAALREHELLPEDLGQLPDQPADENEELTAFENHEFRVHGPPLCLTRTES